ncbi:hypothetical protein HN51_043419 [Arachis hypogaea]
MLNHQTENPIHKQVEAKDQWNTFYVARPAFPKCTPGRKSNGAGGCTYSITVVGRDFSYFRHSRAVVGMVYPADGLSSVSDVLVFVGECLSGVQVSGPCPSISGGILRFRFRNDLFL